MKVSVITPTADRPLFLLGLYSLLKQQTYSEWEWLIYDSSLKPQKFADPQVIYVHDESLVTVGEKRNRLIERASGEAIIHCDDDDYYAPGYLAYIAEKLKKSDFFTLHSWFSYDLKSNQTYYWATDEITLTQFHVNPLSRGCVREIDFGPNTDHYKKIINERGRCGYGFSYAYRKEVAQVFRFQNRDLAEDKFFYQAIDQSQFSIQMEGDQLGKVVHVIHDTNTSGEFPQYRIPRFIAQKHLPEFFTYISRFS